MVFGSLDAVDGDSVAGDELAGFALAGGKTGFGEDIDESFAGFGGWEALGEKLDVVFGEVFDFTIAKEESSEFFGLFCGFFAVDDLGDFVAEAFLAKTSAWIFAVLGEDLIEFFWHDEGEVLEVIFEGVVGLVEPELIGVEDAGFVGIKPDSVAFGLAELAAGDFVDDERARVAVGVGVFEALDEMDARGAVAKLVGTTKLEINVVGAEKVKEIVALDEGVAKFGVRNARAAFADTFLDELAIEELGHTESFADFAEEREEFDVLEPIVVIDKLSAFWRVSDADNLGGESFFVLFDFVEALEVALDSILWVADLASGATDKIVRSITVAYEASAHH